MSSQVWTHCIRSAPRISTDLSGYNSSSSLYVCQIRTVPWHGECFNDQGRAFSQVGIRYAEGMDTAVYQRVPDRWGISIPRTVYADRKPVLCTGSSQLLCGVRHLEPDFLSFQAEPVPMPGRTLYEWKKMSGTGVD